MKMNYKAYYPEGPYEKSTAEMGEITNVMEHQAIAKEKLPKMVYDYYASRAEDEWTLAENTNAFSRILFRPRILIDVSKIDMTTTVLGFKISMLLPLQCRKWLTLKVSMQQLEPHQQLEQSWEIYSFHKAVTEKPIIQCLFVLDDCCIPEEIDDEAIHVVQVNSEVIKKISGVQSIDCVEVIALVRIPSTFQIVSSSLRDEDCRTLLSFPHRLLVLDGIQDPGNLGTLVRSATAFRWDGVFLLPGCCDPFNDKALRASRGACFQIPIVSGNWTHVRALTEEFQMKILAGHPATSNGPTPVTGLSKDFADFIADLPLCLVLGSEGAGLSEHSRRSCELVTIPMAGEFESLNVSVAGGIFMYMLQQHHNSKPASNLTN